MLRFSLSETWNKLLYRHSHISYATIFLNAAFKRCAKLLFPRSSLAVKREMSARNLRHNPCKVRPTNGSFYRPSIVPIHAIRIPHLHRPSTRRLAPRVRSPASIPPPTLESLRDLVSIPGRIILRTNNQPPPLLRPAINRLNNINQLLLILQHPIQLIIVSRPEIAHLSYTHR